MAENQVKVEESERTDAAYPPMVATSAMLQYLREIFMALDNISFQIRTTMNNVINADKQQDVSNFTMQNPNNMGNNDPVIEGTNEDDKE